MLRDRSVAQVRPRAQFKVVTAEAKAGDDRFAEVELVHGDKKRGYVLYDYLEIFKEQR